MKIHTDTKQHARVDWRAVLAAGEGVVFYTCFLGLRAWISKDWPEADVWYTERNGDGIGLLVPKGTQPKEFPNQAMSYLVFEWIDPDKEFGSGHKVR